MKSICNDIYEKLQFIRFLKNKKKFTNLKEI